MQVIAVDRPQAPPLDMPVRFKHEVAYFMTPPGERGAPAALPPGEYWIDPDEVRRWLDDGVIELISPLDSGRHAEVELTEDHERWLEWLLAHDIRHVAFRAS